MAEIKTGIFAKNVQKRLSRAQEKVLQKLGKADETKDEQFEQCVQNFKRQESEGSRLQREMKAYIAAVKGMQQASMNLTESLHEVYEPDWHGKDDVMTIGKNCDALWEDFHQKLVDSTLDTLEAYLTQFPDLKMRVAKRSRKLIDYDSARHHFETLQTSTMRNEKKIAKAEEDLKKAQRVFDDLNVGLQDELPTLWDRRVGFYVSTFKNVSSLEARFHREISFLCHKLYEVMNKLAEQHSDKMFTIQGAPSDSGPLRLARTPTPPDDESPDSSPAASPNHTLRPISPGPPRPKSPTQFKMGPPKPPPPKATPTRELQQEQIIDLFDGGFPEISVSSPQVNPNEKPGESLLDLDFDPFKPDANTPIGQTQSPISQTLPWDLWAGNAEPAQPVSNDRQECPGRKPFLNATDAGFTASWAADFSSPSALGAEESGNIQPAVDGQGWPPAEGWPTEAVPQPQGEAATDEVSSKTFNGFSKDATVPTFATEFDKMSEAQAPEGDVTEGEGEAVPSSVPESVESPVTTPPTDTQPEETTASSPPTEAASLPTEDMEKEQPNQEAPESSPVLEAEESPAEATLATAEDKESPIEETPTVDAKPEEEASSTEAKPGDPDNIEPKPGDEPDHVEPKPRDEPDNVEPKPSDEPDNVESIPGDVPDNVEPQPGDETSKEGASKNGKEEEKMPIPSVVIEPASSNEGDDDRDCDIISPSATSDNGMIPECQTTKESSGMPPRFLFKVETMHDFDAANPDELELKKGDIVLVVPTELSEDQDAGWLTGIKESEWLLLGASAQKGLFPENFTQRLD
ncbi:amphiphysin-like isoform X5 [Myxocyprinus asiaticus]|uniref:amphiphysin-like isoform X5 n=1 Tax=Myxocyprinus asiaticus TaxID=70543 RepID=UPI00222146A9|nr:amphiphysin-like isoform X5 [Myxocyprinus asiaticus]